MVEVGKAAHRTAPGDAASLRRQQRRPASVRSQPPKPDGALSGEGPDTSSSSRVLGLTEGQMPMPTSGGGLDLDIHPRAHLPLLGIFLSPHRRSPPSRHPHCRSPPPRQRLLLLLPPARLLAPERPNHASLLHGILICLCVLAALIAGPVAGRGALDPAGGGALGRRPPRRRLLDRPVHSQLLYRLMLRLYCRETTRHRPCKLVNSRRGIERDHTPRPWRLQSIVIWLDCFRYNLGLGTSRKQGFGPGRVSPLVPVQSRTGTNVGIGPGS
ncbi:uncharacterized protein [Triticum aestivum]|uniref:uncharacterized protein isoform X1 n=1 Tax=Triticum aestivum TaxID=4565 RepID=UPI001D00B1C3|nr:uncharacterized protein LOC123063121 isoform X1 [Triticum aestivum]